MLARTPGAGVPRRPPGTLSPGKRLFFSPQPEEVEMEQDGEDLEKQYIA